MEDFLIELRYVKLLLLMEDFLIELRKVQQPPNFTVGWCRWIYEKKKAKENISEL